MEENNRSLIVVDLDNTILSRLFSLDSFSVNALIQAQNSGHIVMITTASPSCMELPYHRTMGLHGPIATLNGAYCYHSDDPELPTRESLIGEGDIAAILEAITNAEIRCTWLENGDDLYASFPLSFPHPLFQEVFRQSSVKFSEVLPVLPTGRFCAYAETSLQMDAFLARACFKTLKLTKVKYKRGKQPHESRRLSSHIA